MYVTHVYIMYINVYTFIYIHIHTCIHTYINPPHTHKHTSAGVQSAERMGLLASRCAKKKIGK